MRKFETAVLTLGTKKKKLESEIRDLEIDVRNGVIEENMVTMMIAGRKAEVEELEEAIKVLGGKNND